MASMEKELWEMALETIRQGKYVLGVTKMPNMPEQCRLPHPNYPQAPRQEKSTVTPSADIACSDHVKIQNKPAEPEKLAGRQKTDSSIAVQSKKLPKSNILQKPLPDICTQLEERDRLGFEVSQFEKILVDIRKNRISFNQQIKLLLTDIAGLPKMTQGARLNRIKTKVATYRNWSKRLSYEGRQLLESMQNDLWDMDLQIVRARVHCNKDVRGEVLSVRSYLPHPEDPSMTSNTSVPYKKWNSKVSDAASDEGVNKVMTPSPTSAAANVRSCRKRIATIKRQTLCFRKVLKRPVSDPCYFKLVKKEKGMITVSSTSIASTFTDKPNTAGNQVLGRPTKETVEPETSKKSSHDTASVIHVHLKQKKKVHFTATRASNISHIFRKSENTMPTTHVQLSKRKKLSSANNSSYIFSEGIMENQESTVNSKQVSLTQEANPTAANERHIFSQHTVRETDHTMPAARVKLMQEEPLTAPTIPCHSFCSSDEQERKSYSSAGQVKLTRKLSAETNIYEIMGRARSSTLLTPRSTKMSFDSFGFPPTSGVEDGHSLPPLTMTDADVWDGTATKTQMRPLSASALRSVTAGTLSRSHRNIGLKEAQTILEILKMQRDLLVASIHGIRSELDLGKQEDSIWRTRMDELNTELQQIKSCPNRHRMASIRAKAAYLKVQMSNLQLLGNVYLNHMDSVISHLTGEIRGVSCKIMAASPFSIDVNISNRD